AVGADFLAIGRRESAARLRLGRPRLHFDQAHAAIACNRQPLVIAEARDFLAGQFAGLQHGGPVGDLDLDAIDGDFGHYSAASCIAPAPSAIRRSSSGRKWRIRPWIGQAAASPNAQIVWPSTCLVTS